MPKQTRYYLNALLLLVLLAAAARGAVSQTPARQTLVTTDVVYGHKDGLALTFDVHRPTQPTARASSLL